MKTLSMFTFLTAGTILVSTFGTIPAQIPLAEAAIPCRNSYRQDFSWRQLNRTGRVLINNQRTSPVQITLIHPDSASRFASWTINPSNRVHLAHNNQTIYVGDDWGIQIGNGCIFYVGEVGIYSSQGYEITLSRQNQISTSGLVSPYSPGQPERINVSDTFYNNAAWCVWHEGVPLFRAGSRELVPPAYFRTQCSIKQRHNQEVLEMLGNASDKYIQAFMERASRNLALERNFEGNLRWVAYHEGLLNPLRGNAQRGNANEIRRIYRARQGHNPDTRYLDATVSDLALIEMCQRL
ncbi:MAG: hypothetical protein SAL07_10950 [Oscillatoria sp. PMC 1051.18]|nr:hypothetical protein [Oscillatoria sp. PMC 1050.18]MEC5030422.1 hypothetical protein [Oscillatoria sp. PMC 1051.18]